MKPVFTKRWPLIIVALLVCSIFMAFLVGNTVKNNKAINTLNANSKAIVVIELFTSEGCSSCPPADALLQKIDERKIENVYPLSFHVDYWNRLGWKDPYSKAEFSERQRWYASEFSSSRVYTPQMIVNGTTEFVGSNATKAENALKQALDTKAVADIAISNVQQSAKKIDFNYSINGGSVDGRILRIALLQKNAQQNVKSGENRNRKLSHINVVRQFKSIELSRANGKSSIEKPVDTSNLELVFYMQNQKNNQIVAAKAIAIQ